MKDLTLRSLRIFEATVSCASHSKAAEQMGLSQPAVSIQLRQLEEMIGQALFDKQVRPLGLTEAGKELLRHSRAILAKVRVAQDALSSLKDCGGGTLHLGVATSGEYFMPALMAAFSRRHPNIKMQLTVAPRDELLALVRAHRVDMAIGGFPPTQGEVEAEAFARHPHCVIAAPDHPLAGLRDIPWSALADETFLFREPTSTTRQFLQHLLQAQGLSVQVAMQLHGDEALKRGVVAGLGIAFMSAHAFQLELETNKLVVLDVQGMPRMLDWCVLSRMDSVPDGPAAEFRAFVFDSGPGLIACRYRSDLARRVEEAPVPQPG